MTQSLLLRPVSRLEKKPLELPAAGRAAGSSGLPALTAALRDKWREKRFVLKFRETSVLYQFDLIVNLTFLFVLIQHSVAEFSFSCSQTVDDLLFLHYYSWFRQPAFPGGGGGVLVVCLWRIYSWDLLGGWFGEERGRAFSMVSQEVKMYSACDAAPCNGKVCLQRGLKQKWVITEQQKSK